GSETSEASVPLLGMYTAAKHAMKGFTDALRVETEEVDKANVSITLVEPQSVDTPFPQHARNYMDREPRLSSPTVSAERVAKAILRAAVRPTRVARVGGGSMLNTTFARMAPGFADRLAAKQYARQQADRQPVDPRGVLFRSSETTGFVGQMSGLEM
ncbi:MAG TPA: SDR family NAD(P)-dependent oxidoreductase, partial [Planctomycetota bacterium]|nr:SDR family NAD(P)-dependent oxidoreductase [Planctomycetota bacterium]